MNEFLKSHKILGLPSKKAIAKEFYEKQRANNANQLALPAPHAHAHAHDHARVARGLTEIDNLPPDAQFSYDNKELWGAQTHTRALETL